MPERLNVLWGVKGGLAGLAGVIGQCACPQVAEMFLKKMARVSRPNHIGRRITFDGGQQPLHEVLLCPVQGLSEHTILPPLVCCAQKQSTND